jgi:hypothetical protein
MGQHLFTTVAAAVAALMAGVMVLAAMAGAVLVHVQATLLLLRERQTQVAVAELVGGRLLQVTAQTAVQV